MMKEKVLALLNKRQGLLQQLEGPTRAAANQMKDAGMHKGADPLLEILFQIEATDQETKKILNNSPREEVLDFFKEIVSRQSK